MEKQGKNHGDDRPVNIITPENCQTSKYTNTFRIGLTETEVVLEFGEYIPAEDDTMPDRVEVVSSLKFSPELIKKLLAGLYRAGLDYQDNFKNDLGLKNLDSKEKESANMEV